MTRVIRNLSICLVLAASASALAGPKEEAQKHVRKATAAHQAGKFDVALSELQAAYALDPQPDLLFAIGQVHVKLGQCDKAIDDYKQFLATNPPPDAATVTNEAIASCEAQLPPPPPPPPPAPAPVAPPPPPPPPPPPSTPFYGDYVADALVGGGVVSGTVGIVLYSLARSDIDEADKATTYPAQQKLVDRANSKRGIAVVLGIGGIALIGGGIAHFVLQTRADEQPPVAVVPTQGGGLVTWKGSF